MPSAGGFFHQLLECALSQKLSYIFKFPLKVCNDDMLEPIVQKPHRIWT